MKKGEEVEYNVNSLYVCNTVAYQAVNVASKMFIKGGSKGKICSTTDSLNDEVFRTYPIVERGQLVNQSIQRETLKMNLQ